MATLASFTDITTAIGANQNAVSKIGDLITANEAGLLSYLGVTATDKVVGTAFLPNNDVVDDNAGAVRYLANRPQAFYETIAAHLSGDAGTFEDPTGATDPDPLPTDLTVKDGLTINTFLTGFQLISEDAPVRRGQNGLDWDAGSQGLQPAVTLSLAGGAITDAIVGVYANNVDFILPQASLPDEGLGTAEKSILTVLTEDDGATPIALGIEDITALIAAHGLDILAADEKFENNILTAFLPTDDALSDKFGDDTSDVVTFLSWNKFATQLILGNHAVNGTIGYWSENVVNDGAEISLTTLGGKELKIPTGNTDVMDLKLGLDTVSDVVTIDATTDFLNIFTENMVVHTFGSGLLATGDDLSIVSDALDRGENITDTLDPAKHATLIALFGLASEGVQKAINSNSSVTTLLAPTEEAFNKLAENQKAYLTDEANQDQLDLVLKAHLLNKPFWTGYEAAAGLEDSNGFDPECSGSMCGGSMLSDPAYAKYGVRYSVDTVIIPADNTIPAPESSSESNESSDSSNSAASALSVAGFLTAGCAFVLALL